jgi:hypothetical protein
MWGEQGASARTRRLLHWQPSRFGTDASHGRNLAGKWHAFAGAGGRSRSGSGHEVCTAPRQHDTRADVFAMLNKRAKVVVVLYDVAANNNKVLRRRPMAWPRTLCGIFFNPVGPEQVAGRIVSQALGIHNKRESCEMVLPSAPPNRTCDLPCRPAQERWGCVSFQ